MANGSKWSLRKKLVCMGLTIGALAPLLGLYMNYKLNLVAENYSVVADVKLGKTKILGDLQFKFRQIRIPLRSIPVLNTDRAEIREYITETEAAVSDFTQSLAAYEETIEHAEEKALVYELKAAAQPFLKFGSEMLAIANQLDDKPELKTVLAEEIRKTCPVKAAPVEDALKKLVDFQSTEAGTYVSQAHERENAATFAAWSGSGVSLGLAFLLSILFSNTLNGQLRSLADQLRRLAGAVRESSDQLENSASTLSKSTTEEAAALAETAASMEQVSAMIEQTSRNVSTTLEVANEGRSEASNGRQELRRMIESMNEIQDSNDKLEKMVKLITEIKEKTQVINDIVFETRLLSFNASIEAARAGSQGKGFAVVAEEVGNLATVSGKAADEIRALLESSTQEVSEIVQGTKERISKGRNNAEDCERAFEKMGSVLERIAESVSSIEKASAEQERGVRESNGAISQMDVLSQNISIEADNLKREASKLSTEAATQTQSVFMLNHLIEGTDEMMFQLNMQAKSSEGHQHSSALEAQAIQLGELNSSKNRVKVKRPAAGHRASGSVQVTKRSEAQYQDAVEDVYEEDTPERGHASWKQAG